MNCPECQTELVDATCTIYCPKEGCNYYQGVPPLKLNIQSELVLLKGALQTIQGIAEGSTTANSLQHIAKIAGKALT